MTAKDTGLRQLLEKYEPTSIFAELLMNKLGVKTYVAPLDERLHFQRLVYILTNQKIFSIYPFGWYLRGPYSTELTNACYDISSSVDNISNKVHLDSKTEKGIDSVITKIGEDNKRDYKWMEYAACILWANSNGYSTKDLYTRRLSRLKKDKVKHVAKSLRESQLLN